jgi:hypothetical protein
VGWLLTERRHTGEFWWWWKYLCSKYLEIIMLVATWANKIVKNYQSMHLKWVHFIVHKVYLDNARLFCTGVWTQGFAPTRQVPCLQPLFALVIFQIGSHAFLPELALDYGPSHLTPPM